MDTAQRSAQLRTTPRAAEPRPFPGFSPLQAAEIWIAGTLALAAFATIVPLAAIGLDPHHDGIMLKPALDVADGQVLFRDTFSQYGPLTTFLHALVLRVSPRLLALKIVTVAADAFTLGVLYLVWRAILPRSLAFVSAAIFLLLNPLFDTDWTVLPWSSDMAMLFQAIAWLALVQTLVATRPVPWAILLGVAAAAVFWCRQPVGLSLIGTLVVVAAGLPVAGWQGGIGPRSGVVSALAAVSGMAAVSGLVLGYLWANDALAAWWFQNIVWPRRWAIADSGGFFAEFINQLADPWTGCVSGLLLAAALSPSIARAAGLCLPQWADWAAVSTVAAGIWVLSPLSLRAIEVWQGGWWEVAFFAVATLGIWRLITVAPPFAGLRPQDYFVSAAIAAVALASLPQLYPLLCRRHVFWAIAPVSGVAVYAIWRASACRPTVLAAALALAVAPNALRELEAGRNKIKLTAATITKPGVLEGIRVGSDEADSADRMADILRHMEQASPSRPFTMIGNDALPLACVGNRMNISPFYVTWPGLMSAADEARWSTRFGDVRPFLILQAVSLASRATFLSQHDYKLIGEIPEKKLAFLAPAEVVVTAMQRSGKSPQRFTEQADDRSRRLRSILPKN